MSKRFEDLEEALCRELEILDKKYGSGGTEMSPQDVEKADKLYHALKSAETYHAMADAEWDDEDEDESGRGGRNGRSYARRRDSMGRYTSRDMGRGYSGDYGYSAYSGRYPDWMPPYYPQRY